MRKKISYLNQSADKLYQSRTTRFTLFNISYRDGYFTLNPIILFIIPLLLVGCGKSDIENQLDGYLKNPKATGVLMVKQLAIDMPTENIDYVCYLLPYQYQVGQYYDKNRPIPMFAQKINKALATQKFSSIFEHIGNLVFLNKDDSIFIVEIHGIPIYPNSLNKPYFGEKSGKPILDCVRFNQAAFDVFQADIDKFYNSTGLWLGLIETTN